MHHDTWGLKIKYLLYFNLYSTETKVTQYDTHTYNTYTFTLRQTRRSSWVTFPLCSRAPKGDANVYTYVVRQKANKTIAFLEEAPVLESRVDEGTHRYFHAWEKKLPVGRRNTQLTSEALRNRLVEIVEERETKKRGWKAHPVGIVSGEFTVLVAIPGSIFCICSPRQRRQSRNLFSRPGERPPYPSPCPFKLLVNH